MNNFRKIINITKGPLNYFSSLFQVIQTLYTIVLSLILFYNSPITLDLRYRILFLNPLIKSALLLLLFFSFYFWIKNIFEKTLFILESNKFNAGLVKNIDSNTGLMIDDYHNILPPNRIVVEIYNQFYSRAIKWSKDCYLANSILDIFYNKKNISISIKFEFFSPSKKSTIEFHSTDLKIPQTTRLEPTQLQKEDFRVKFVPFFNEKSWRRLVVNILGLVENEIAGRDFYLSVGSEVFGSTRVYLDAGFIPKKVFTYYFKDRKIYRDLSCTDLVKFEL